MGQRCGVEVGGRGTWGYGGHRDMGTLGNGVIWHCGQQECSATQGDVERWGRDEGHSDMGMYGDMGWRCGAEMGLGVHCHPAALEVAVLNAGRGGKWQTLH